MTPNPNPSPELIDEMTREIWDAAPIRTHAEARELADTLAALSPQTLPAPGEVEHGAGWVAWNPDSGEEYTPNHPIESGECVEAERIRRSTPQEDVLWNAFQGEFQRAHDLETRLAATPTLATVAAANDEGVAEAIEAAAKVAENPGFIEARDTEWDAGVNYAKRYIAAAIRLLPQGGGKA